MSRVLVTGGTGFVGRWVVAELLARGDDVVIFDARPNPAALDEIRQGMSESVTFVTGDIADGSVADAMDGCNGIVHLAGVMTVEAAADPLRAAAINLMGSLHVFEAALRHKIDRLVYVSTAGVFGPDDRVNPRPMTHYGAQKLAIEGSARAYHADHGLPSVGFRPYIVYGPGQSSGIAAGPSIALGAAMRGEPATIRFSGRVGFVHVFDVARLMAIAVSSPMQGAEAYTLCGETAEMADFVSALKAQVPQASVSVDGPPLRIPADLATSEMPPELAAAGITGLNDGIALTLEFYRARQQGRTA